MNKGISNKKWYNNKTLIIVLFFVFTPLGIYGMIKRKTKLGKKLLYIIPGSLITLFVFLGILATLFTDYYESGLDYYNKKDYSNAYKFFKMVKPKDKNYNDAIIKISELKPILDSINTFKQIENSKVLREKEKKGNDKNKQKIEHNQLEYPIIQQDFIKTINEYKIKYSEAPNELKKSALRSERGNELKEILENKYNFSNWVCLVHQMETTRKGKAIFVVKFGKENIRIGTMNNEFSDLFDKTLIEQSNPLFEKISELKKGDKVLVSGTFLISNNNDYVMEQSITEEGSMKNPEFLVKFTKIKKQL